MRTVAVLLWAVWLYCLVAFTVMSDVSWGEQVTLFVGLLAVAATVAAGWRRR